MEGLTASERLMSFANLISTQSGIPAFRILLPDSSRLEIAALMATSRGAHDARCNLWSFLRASCFASRRRWGYVL